MGRDEFVPGAVVWRLRRNRGEGPLELVPGEVVATAAGPVLLQASERGGFDWELIGRRVADLFDDELRVWHPSPEAVVAAEREAFDAAAERAKAEAARLAARVTPERTRISP